LLTTKVGEVIKKVATELNLGCLVLLTRYRDSLTGTAFNTRSARKSWVEGFLGYSENSFY